MNNKLIRCAALLHEALGLSRVKVIFRDESGKEYAHWMNREIYDAIPLMVKATLEDYKKIGEVVEAQNTDIYSDL